MAASSAVGITAFKFIPTFRPIASDTTIRSETSKSIFIVAGSVVDVQSTGTNTIKLNSRNYTNTSGDAIGFQATPSQTATSTGEIFGAQIKPRVQNGLSVAGLKGLGIDTELKGTGATTCTGDMANLNTYLGTGGASNVTSGHVSVLRCRAEVQNAMASNKWLTPLQILNHEGSTAWSGLINLNAALGTHSISTNSDKTGNAKSGTLKVLANNTLYHIQLYAD